MAFTEIAELESLLGHQFREPRWLHQALMHSSRIPERAEQEPAESNEKLEFLGDAVLELVAKDPDVRKNLSKVTIWVDPDRAVSLKQVFTLSATSSKVCLYSDFNLNKSLPGDAFTFKADH